MRKTKILIIISAIVLLILSLLLYWQYGNMKALYYSQKYSNDDINVLIEKHYDEIDKYLKENEKYNVRPSTELEQKLHSEELLTDDEFIDILTGKTDVEQLFGTDISLNDKKEYTLPDGTSITKNEIETAKKQTNSKSESDSNLTNNFGVNNSDDKADKNTQTDDAVKPNNQDKKDSSSKLSTQDKPDSSSKPSNQDKPDSSSKPSNQDKPDSSSKPSNQDKPDSSSKPNNQDNLDNSSKPKDSDNPGDTSKNDAPEKNESNNQVSSEEKISDCIARMYVLKSSFESQLSAIYAEEKARFLSYPYEQRKNMMSEFAKNIYGRASTMESNCDAQVNAVLSELESELKASGQDLELVNRIRTAYTEEKSLKKAYYLNLYKS